MLNPLRKVPTKRSSSVSDKRIPNRAHFDYQEHRIQTEQNDSYEEPFDAANRVVHTEPGFEANGLLDRNASLYAEIERLCDFNYKLNQDNKALALKAASNNHLHKKVTELEALNAQLLKDLARKDDLLLSKEREIVTLNQDNARKRQVQSTYTDLLTQNRALNDEVSSLKTEIEIKSRVRNASEYAADSSPRKFHIKLEQANLQIDSLREDLIGRNMEIEELKDRLKSQSHNHRSSFTPSPIKRSSAVFDDESLLHEKRQLISDLKEELQTAHRESDLITKRSESLKIELLNKEHTISTLTQDLEHLRRRQVMEEKEMEQIIKRRINDSIKKILQEKIQYEEEINFLKEKVQHLEREAADFKVEADFEWQKLYTEKTELKHSHLQKKDQEIKLLEEKCQNLENTLFEKEKEIERNFQSYKEKDNSRKLLEENQKLQREIADHTQQIEIVTQDCQKLASLYTELEEQHQAERQEKQHFAQKYADLQKELGDSRTKQLSSFTHHKKRLEDESVHLSGLNDQLNNQVSELNKLLFQKERETIQHFETIENLRRENNKLKSFLHQEITQDNVSYSYKKSLNNAEKELSKYKMEVNRLNLSVEESNVYLGGTTDRSEL